MGKIKSILKQPIKNLGHAGDVVDIKRGYFNYLEGQDKVEYASKENIRDLESNLEMLKQEDEKRKKQAEEWAEKIKGITLSFSEEGSDTGVLYGSVTTRHISKAIKAQGIELGSNQVRISRPLKECGEYDVSLDLYPGVQTQVKVVIGLKGDASFVNA